MYEIRIEIAKNRLYTTLSGFFSTEEAKKAVDEVIEATQKLKPGYDVITDVTLFKPASPEAAKEIGRVQAHFATSGLRRGLRVIGANTMAELQFNRLAKQTTYDANNVATVEDAEKILDQL